MHNLPFEYTYGKSETIGNRTQSNITIQTTTLVSEYLKEDKIMLLIGKTPIRLIGHFIRVDDHPTYVVSFSVVLHH